MRKPDAICLHHSLTKDGKTVSWGAVRKWHMGLHPESPYVDRPMLDIGYTYGIELINDRHEVLVGRMLGQQGAHCWQQGMNSRSVGILFTGDFDLAPPCPEMWDLGLRLVRSLCWLFKIPVSSVYGHRELADYKTCPGKLFDLGKFRFDLIGYVL